MLNVEARQQLRNLLPLGMLSTKPWLISQGLNPHFVDNAVRSKTLCPLVAGVFVLHDSYITWEGVVTSLQRMSNAPVYVGGLSALALLGLSQYLSSSTAQNVHLYSKAALPRWIARLPLDVHFTWHGTLRLWPDAIMAESTFSKAHQWREELPPVLLSCAEKAILELLMNVPDAISFEHADELMQGLHNLSPKKLDALLKSCTNVKVKRLFLWLAQRQGHAWFNRLTPLDYNLGAGKRVVAVEGRLDNTWLITVPKNM
jgi:hypothetical protein